MGYLADDVYGQPEKFGLTVLDIVDDPEADYSFNLIVVWKHEDGRIFWAQDAGCSCPSPFEDFTSLDDLTLLTDETWAEFEEAVKLHAAPGDYLPDKGEMRYDLDMSHHRHGAEKVEMLSKAAAELRKLASA